MSYDFYMSLREVYVEVTVHSYIPLFEHGITMIILLLTSEHVHLQSWIGPPSS